jgi:hypothetical protein
MKYNMTPEEATKQLKELEEQFMAAGYTQEMIDETKYDSNEDHDISMSISNLLDERSYWSTIV